MDILGRLVIVSVFVLASVSTLTAVAQPVFQQSRVVSEKRDDSRHYILPLGRIKLDRSLGRDMPATYKRLDGEFSSTVWELTSDENIREARDRVQVYLDTSQQQMLFSCSSRDCGESFAWANAMFNEPQLYGNDRTQSLWVVKVQGARRYHVYYLIERPNRRMYFYRETLFVPDLELDEKVIKSMLDEQGYLILGEVIVNSNGKPDFSVILEKLLHHGKVIKPELLVVHRHGDALNKDGLAEGLATRLKEQGMAVIVRDAANLTPRVEAPGSIWVEWVAPDWKP